MRVHTALKIFICLGCKTAWTPRTLRGHLTRTHNILISDDDEDHLQSLVDKHQMPVSAITTVPQPGGPPVECIQVIPQAHCCNACTFCCLSADVFRKHWSQTHGTETGPSSKRFHFAAVQTLYSPLPRHFFEVNPSLTNISSESLFAIFLKNEVPNIPPFPAAPPTSEREVPILLAMTQWHKHLETYLGNYQMRKSLTNLVRLTGPTDKTNYPGLGSLVFEYAKAIRELSSKVPLGVKCLLLECPRYVD